MSKLKKEPVCSITASLDVLGGKWKVFILSQLVQGTRRFGELKKGIPNVTQKMLTQQLRELEDAGLVQRKVYPEVPPRVEYALTAHGITLGPVLRSLNEWGQQHLRFLGEIPTSCRVAAAPVLESTVEVDPLSHAALTEAVRAASM
jgi:DNA-binding HxlR family transcriptional regulator